MLTQRFYRICGRCVYNGSVTSGVVDRGVDIGFQGRSFGVVVLIGINFRD